MPSFVCIETYPRLCARSRNCVIEKVLHFAQSVSNNDTALWYTPVVPQSFIAYRDLKVVNCYALLDRANVYRHAILSTFYRTPGSQSEYQPS
jgi:hypothetical protein